MIICDKRILKNSFNLLFRRQYLSHFAETLNHVFLSLVETLKIMIRYYSQKKVTTFTDLWFWKVIGLIQFLELFFDLDYIKSFFQSFSKK